MTFVQRHPRLAGALVSLVTTGLLLAAIEAVFPWVVPFVPLPLQGYLPPPVYVLAQSSKRGLIPRDYTALLGDSYAQGEGDWHVSLSGLGNPPFHSAHLLRDAGLGDVVSFGRAGAGSLEGVVLLPLGSEAYLNTRSRFAAIGPPTRALIYFYEGNDLNNNLRTLREHFLPRHGADALFDDRRFQAFIESRLEADPLVAQARTMNWRTRIIAGRFFAALVRYGPGLLPSPVPLSEEAPPGSSRRVNRARVGGEERDLPDGLQGPSLELTDEELRASIWVFQQTLRFVMGRWPSTRFTIVHIPSPLSCYALEGGTVLAQSYEGRGPGFPVSRVRENSDRIADELRGVAEAASVAFIDTRPELRDAAARRPVHGPKDWRHLNQAGYQALTRAVLAGLASPRETTPRDPASITSGSTPKGD